MRSRGQVIHIAEDTHAALKAYCAEQGHDMSAFVAGLIVGEVTRLRDGDPTVVAEVRLAIGKHFSLARIAELLAKVPTNE